MTESVFEDRNTDTKGTPRETGSINGRNEKSHSQNGTDDSGKRRGSRKTQRRNAWHKTLACSFICFFADDAARRDKRSRTGNCPGRRRHFGPRYTARTNASCFLNNNSGVRDGRRDLAKYKGLIRLISGGLFVLIDIVGKNIGTLFPEIHFNGVWNAIYSPLRDSTFSPIAKFCSRDRAIQAINDLASCWCHGLSIDRYTAKVQATKPFRLSV